jgi:hypothetical protein
MGSLIGHLSPTAHSPSNVAIRTRLNKQQSPLVAFLIPVLSIGLWRYSHRFADRPANHLTKIRFSLSASGNPTSEPVFSTDSDFCEHF